MAIEIHHYNPQWPELFEAERDRVMGAVSAHVVAFEHIGSTAVPGLAAKPIIDMMAGVLRLEHADACVEPLASLGYEYVQGYEAFFPERRFFRRTVHGQRTHNLHMVAVDSDFWDRHILFRDYLRTHPRTAAHYETLKQVLKDRCTDVEAYTAAKTAFIQSIETLARDERDGRI